MNLERNYIIKLTHLRRHKLGKNDYIKHSNLLKEFTPLEPIKPMIIYGYLYNHYTVVDQRNITSSNEWRVANIDDVSNLSIFLDEPLIDGRRLKSKRQINSPFLWDYDLDLHPRWEEDNNYGIDYYGFNAVPGGGWNHQLNKFDQLGFRGFYWFRDLEDHPEGLPPTEARYFHFDYNSDRLRGIDNILNYNRMYGKSIKLLRDATEEEIETLPSNIYMDNYIGNNGLEYKTVKIGEQVWVCDNLCETQYRNGESITYFLENSRSFLYYEPLESTTTTIEPTEYEFPNGYIKIIEGEKLKISKKDLNGVDVSDWLDSIPNDSYCRLYKKGEFNNYWSGKKIEYLEEETPMHRIFAFNTIQNNLNVEEGDELILINFYPETPYYYCYDNDLTYSRYPNNPINIFSEISYGEFLKLTTVEYSYRVKEFLKHHISKPDDRTEMINTRKNI